MSAPTAAPPTEQISRLQRLAPELRNEILGHLLQNPGHIDLVHDIDAWTTGSEVTDPLALAKTCRQFHREFAARFYATNTFHIRSTTNKLIFSSGKHFLSGIGTTNARALKGMVLTWIPPIPGPYRNVYKASDALREIVDACGNGGKSTDGSVDMAELLSLTTFVHIELQFRLCNCYLSRDMTYTISLDCANIMPSFRAEWQRMARMKTAWSKSWHTPTLSFDGHKSFLLGVVIEEMRKILDEQHQAE